MNPSISMRRLKPHWMARAGWARVGLPIEQTVCWKVGAPLWSGCEWPSHMLLKFGMSVASGPGGWRPRECLLELAKGVQPANRGWLPVSGPL